MVNCWSTLPWVTLVVGYMGQEAAAFGGGYVPNSLNNYSCGWHTKG